jgi:putative transposase
LRYRSSIIRSSTVLFLVRECRKHGISEASFYNWKAKYGGLEVSEAKRLKGQESENARLKKLLADAMLDNAALKDLLAKKW